MLQIWAVSQPDTVSRRLKSSHRLEPAPQYFAKNSRRFDVRRDAVRSAFPVFPCGRQTRSGGAGDQEMGQRCTEARGRNHHLTENFALHSTQQQLTNTPPSPGPPLSPSTPPYNIELSPSLPFSYYRFRPARHFRSNYGQFAAFLTGAVKNGQVAPGTCGVHFWSQRQAQARARTN